MSTIKQKQETNLGRLCGGGGGGGRSGACCLLLSLLLLLETVLLEWTHEGAFLLVRLKSTVAELRRRVDEAQVDHLAMRSLLVENERFTKGDGTLLRANAAALDHDEIVLDLTVMWETALGAERGRSVVGHHTSLTIGVMVFSVGS